MWNIASSIMRRVLPGDGLGRASSEKGSGRSIALCTALFFAAAVSSCGNYDPLPPKTEAATSYYIPAAEAPTQAEIDEMKAERAEYDELTK